ncbi:MAG: SLBB domain-containing protein [Bacteroidales bacterium]|nr:SLBB domain-containing protein [Bacteroidales bacterium]
MKKFFLAALLILLSLAGVAQTITPSMMNMARTELAKRGLEEEEVRARLMEEGIDVDNIPPTQYASYRNQVIGILNKMQQEKAAANAAANAALFATPSTAAYDMYAAPVISAEEAPQTTTGEAEAEKALKTALDENKVSPTAGKDIYGHSLFTGKSMDVFRTTDGAQAPDTYVLGEGDEIHISIFGGSQTEIHQRIAADGSIQPVGAAKIFLKGMTLAQGRQAIRTKLAQHYSFRQDQIAVTITTARTVTVSIYGEVGVQGGFTLSALNTAFNALAAAGGPTAIGSVRNIQIHRGGKTGHLDLYAYMTNPAQAGWYDLQNGDVIYVPVAQRVVSVTGAVNRPMRYEILDDESLKDAIGYAGGLTADALTDFVQVERLENGEKKYLEYNLAEVLSGSKKVYLANGDTVRVRTANQPMENYVSISGDVYYGGEFDLEKNSSLAKLIENAKPSYTARTDYVFVERTKSDETVEVLTVPFPGVNGNPDFRLQARDAVFVLQQSNFRDVDTIAVTGQVRKPFTKEYGLKDRMTVAQAIEYADGLKPSVFPVAYIFRRDVSNPSKMEYLRIALDKDGDKLLQPGDELRIYDNTTYTNVGEVSVSGAVKNPFGTPYDPALTVRNLLEMAGGFEVGAAYDRVEVFRVNLSKKDQVSFDKFTFSVDENYNLTSGDFQIQPYDHIIVRMTPNFTKGRTVEVNGRVKYPGMYVLEDNRTQLSEVIKMAGGLLDDASPDATLFRTFKERGNIGVNLDDMSRHKGSTACDPILLDGDVITIYRQENTVTIREAGTHKAQYVPDEFSKEQTTFTYQGRHSAKWYINRYAGGFQKAADRNSVTVTYPNGQSDGTKKALWVFRKYPTVRPGGTITLTMDSVKMEKDAKPKEKVDWERVAASSLSSLTSIVSMILLIERLR